MKTTMKRAAALLLAILLTFSLAGCYSENLTWAAKLGDDTLPTGGYIYYLSSAYSDAAAMVDSEAKILDSQIEGVDAEQWILDRTELYIQHFFWVEQEMERLGLEMTEADYADANATTTYYWSLYGDYYEEYGVAKSSFDLTFSQYSIKAQKVFEALYGENGEKALSDDELEAYFTDTYYHYEYFTVPMLLPNAEGKLVDMTADEIEALEKNLENVKKQIKKGEQTMAEAAEHYAKVYNPETETTESSYIKETNSVLTFANNGMPSEFPNTLAEMKDNEIQIFESSANKVILKRLPIEDMLEVVLENNDNRLDLMIEMKHSEYVEYVKAEAAKLDTVEMNSKTIKRYEPKMFAVNTGAYGTASAE